MTPILPDPKDYGRFCPGEERMRISDAVCSGRRRVNFPKCKGCRFNDEEKLERGRAGQAAQEAKPPEVVEAADVRPARAAVAPKPEDTLFAGGEVRGRYPEPLDEDAAWRMGQATAQFLRSELRGYERTWAEKSTVIVGRDMRRSSPSLSAALIEGLRCGGTAVMDLGMVDTPQLYFAINQTTCCGGVQVTPGNSHPGWNGFKICAAKGKRVSTDTGLAKIGKIARNTHRHAAVQMAGLSSLDLTDSYRAFVRDFLREDAGTFSEERPLKVVVDACNGMAGRWFPLVFGDVPWMEIIRLNFEHNGEFVHEPDPSVEDNLSQLCDRVIRSKADLGVCFDDDADRCRFVDGAGQPVHCDVVTALLAPAMLRMAPGAAVVYDVCSSRLVPEEIRKAGGVPRRERCGQAFQRKTLADGKGIFGGDSTGHYYFRDNWYCASAMIAFAELVNLLDQGKPLGGLTKDLKAYYRSGQRNFPVENPQPVLEKIADRYQNAEIDTLDGLTVQYADWWFNLRPSRSEPVMRMNVEAASQAMLDEKLGELVELLDRS